MARKQLDGDTRSTVDSAKPDQLRIVKQEDEPDERALARTALRPTVNNALTAGKILRREFGPVGLGGLVDELSAQCAAVSDGKMGRPEALLTAQAHTLDALFNDLTRLAYRNWSNLEVAERLLRLAFKAQAQGRATVETLGNLRNPPMVIARQANIAHGPQQVNNESSRTREMQSEQSKLLEQTHGERLDAGATGQTVGGDSQLATVGTFDGPQDGDR